jgi:hypothetical protein
MSTSKIQIKVPSELRASQYRSWEMELAVRYPLALSEMLWPSVPINTAGTMPLASWGIDIVAGWREVLARLLERLEMAIAAQPVGERDRFRVLQIKEKYGRLTAYLASEGKPEMEAALEAATDESAVTCEVCGAAGRLAKRETWWSTRCGVHETWRPGQTSI